MLLTLSALISSGVSGASNLIQSFRLFALWGTFSFLDIYCALHRRFNKCVDKPTTGNQVDEIWPTPRKKLYSAATKQINGITCSDVVKFRAGPADQLETMVKLLQFAKMATSCHTMAQSIGIKKYAGAASWPDAIYLRNLPGSIFLEKRFLKNVIQERSFSWTKVYFLSWQHLMSNNWLRWLAP